MKKLPIGLLFFCLLLGKTELNAQTRIYDIVTWGDTIGMMITKKTGNEKNFHCSVTSEVVFTLFGRRQMNYDFKAVFKDGILLSGSTRNTVNGEIRSSSSVGKSKDGYSVMVDDERKFVPSGGFDYSTVCLYFEEPKGVTKLFSERFGEPCSVKALGGHKYELSLPNGKENRYSYKDGVCTEVQVNHPLATLYFKLRQD